jgi:hemoglobin
MNSSQTIYEILGQGQINQLASDFYQEVALKPNLRSLYPENLAEAEARLALFLIQVFGGPQTYSEQRGHPRLRMRHFKWEINARMRDLWLEAMFTAIDKQSLDPTLKAAMSSYFTNTANHMINHE